MSFPRYPAYKDSGVEWLGELPTHWSVAKVKALTSRISSGKTPLGGSETYIDEGVLFLRSQNVYDDGLRLEDAVFISEATDESMAVSRVQSGDVLLNITGASIGRSCVVPAGFQPANVNQHVCAIRPRSGDVGPFLSWLFKSHTVKSQIDLAQNGAAREGLNFEQIGNISVPIAPPEEQAELTAFLDRETAKIDALVAEQEQLITLLKEKRQAVISHAVTKGLDPSVPMKDSGVEWLGKVPAHWHMLPLKRVSPAQTVGIVVNPSTYVCDDGLPFIYGGDIADGVVHYEEARRISVDLSDSQPKTRLSAGDLVTVRVGAPGVTAVVPPECEGGNCASVMLIRRGNFNSDWLCFLMNSRVVRYQVEVVQYGAAQEQFNIAHATEFVLPVPPVDEQNVIAEELMSEVERLEGLGHEAETVIRLLQERRSALISAAVTGQIDVRSLESAHAA
jgi:type I restriction enzyme S subunit